MFCFRALQSLHLEGGEVPGSPCSSTRKYLVAAHIVICGAICSTVTIAYPLRSGARLLIDAALLACRLR